MPCNRSRKYEFNKRKSCTRISFKYQWHINKIKYKKTQQSNKHQTFVLQKLSDMYLRGRILKQSIVWVEHLLRYEVKPLSGHATIVEPLFSNKLYPESSLQQVWCLHWHNTSIGILQHFVSFHLQLKAVGDVSLIWDRKKWVRLWRGVSHVWCLRTLTGFLSFFRK